MPILEPCPPMSLAAEHQTVQRLYAKFQYTERMLISRTRRLRRKRIPRCLRCQIISGSARLTDTRPDLIELFAALINLSRDACA